MIIDVTGIELTPGNGGKDCKGNGRHFDENGNTYECCCDECDYMLCCIDESWGWAASDYLASYDISGLRDCKICAEMECPRNDNPNLHHKE